MPCTVNWTDEWTLYSQLALVITGLVYATATILMLRKLTAQVKSASQHSLAALSNEHNWRLRTFQTNAVPTLPSALPSWENLDPEEWTWRVLHLNHLNLFRIVWSDQKDHIFPNQQEVDDWVDKGRFIFSTCTGSDPQYAKGRRQLQQILKKEEGYPDDFYNWLVDSGIIPSSFVPERRPTRVV